MLDVKLIVFTLCYLSCGEIVCLNYCDICATPGSHTLCKYVDVDETNLQDIFTKTAFVASPSAACLGYEQQARLSDDEGRLILARINERRNAVALGLANSPQLPCAANMRKMEWSSELAVMAQRWVDQCDADVQPDRQDNCRDLENMAVGQNIATVVGAAPGLLARSLVDIWFMQSLDYSGWVSYFNESAISTTGFFTQLVWAESHLVGCGKAKFQVKGRGAVERLVCNFAPSGNIFGSAVYAVGYPATRCPPNTTPDAEYPALCREALGELEISTTEKSTLQLESSLLRILNFPNATVSKINQSLVSFKSLEDQSISIFNSTRAGSQKIRQISYNKTYDLVEDYYDFGKLQKNQNKSLSSNQNKSEPAKLPSNLLKQSYFGSVDRLNSEAMRYNPEPMGYYPEAMRYNSEAMRYNPDAMGIMQGHGNLNQRRKEHKCTRRRFDGFNLNPSEHICTRNSHSDPCSSSPPCKHEITTASSYDACGDHANKQGCNKCILCSRPTSTTQRRKQCTCDEQCQCLNTKRTTHECTSTECTQSHLPPSTMCSHGFKLSPATEPRHYHDGVTCTETHGHGDRVSRRFSGRLKNVKAFEGNTNYKEELDQIYVIEKTKLPTPYIDDDYLEDDTEWKPSKSKKKVNIPKDVIKKHNKSDTSKPVSDPSFYDYFAYSQRKRRDIKMDLWQPDGDYIDMRQISPKKYLLKGLKFTTLSKKINRKATTKTRSPRNDKRTESITVKFRTERPDNDNHKEHLKDRYLSFDELMNLKRSNNRADYIEHEYDETLGHRTEESNKISTKGQFSIVPQRRSDNKINTPSEKLPDTTTIPKIKWCTRRHTCTWTAPVPADGNKVNINLSKFPYGYVEGCTRTSTCTRINYERNTKTENQSGGQEDGDADEYCDEKRSLDLGAHAHDEYDSDAHPGNNGKVLLRSLDHEEDRTTVLPSQVPSVEDNYNIQEEPQTEISFIQSETKIKSSRSIAELKHRHNVCSCHSKRAKRDLNISKLSLSTSAATIKSRISISAEDFGSVLSYGDIFYQVLGTLLDDLERKKEKHFNRCPCYNKSLRLRDQFVCFIFIPIYLCGLFI